MTATSQQQGPQPHRHEAAEAAGELGADAGGDDLQHLAAVTGVDGEGQAVHDLERVFKCLHVAANDDGRVQAALQERLRHMQHLAGCIKRISSVSAVACDKEWAGMLHGKTLGLVK